jgi:hypothetical protein
MIRLREGVPDGKEPKLKRPVNPDVIMMMALQNYLFQIG